MLSKIFPLILLFITMTAFTQEDQKDKHSEHVSLQVCETFNNRMIVLTLNRLKYERIKPNSLYVGVDTWSTLALAHNAEFNKSLVTRIGKAECQMGYNFRLSEKSILTPTLGFGKFVDFGRYSYKDTYYEPYFDIYYERFVYFDLPPVFYGAAGFKYNYAFNSIFNLGINFQTLIGKSPKSKEIPLINWGNQVFGFECGLPMTFRFGHSRRWEFQLEPFDIFLCDKRRHFNFFGVHFSFGYRY